MAMRDLLYFNPDPNIPDADLLGYGDLVFSDGTTEYLYEDPEMAMGLPPPPPGVRPMGSIGMGPPAPPSNPLADSISAISQAMPAAAQGQQPIVTGADGQQYTPNLATGQFEPFTGVQDPQTGELYAPGDPSNILPALGGEIANAAQGYPQPIGTAWEQQMGPGAGAGLAPQQPGGDLKGSISAISAAMPAAAQGQQPIVQGADGRQYTPDLATGQFVPVERQGALPDGMFQQQQAAMGLQNQAMLDATQQSRSEEVRLYNELVLKQMAANEVERNSRQQDLMEQQEKLARWEQEQQVLMNQGFETDLVSARGPVGAALAVAGATLLGAIGNDAGFRNIENTLDQYVRLQVKQRDTKLGALAEQIGSARQAINMGKAALYKATADRLELMAVKTKNDIYAAQTPMVIETLRQKQLDYMQKAERDSIGKIIEKVPGPPKPPSPERLQKYGELRRDRDASTGMVQRVEQQLGLMWAPGQNGQPGHYANGREVLQNGIQGVGELEQWMPDFVYSTLGQQEGIQVRGAAQALAYAQIRQMQPTGPISNADIQAAVKAGALETEEGLIRGLERMRVNEEKQSLNDAAQFGQDVVTEYDRQYRASGGQPQTAQPAASRPATLQELRGGAQSLRQGAAPQAMQSSTGGMPAEPEERLAMLSDDLQVLGGDMGIPPDGLAILMAQAGHETNDGKNLPNFNYFGMKSSPRNRAAGAGSANLETTEGAGSKAQRVRQNFATFNSSTEAAADMLSLLQRKYPMAVEALQEGDPAAYVEALHAGGFFTANPTVYLNGLLRRL